MWRVRISRMTPIQRHNETMPTFSSEGEDVLFIFGSQRLSGVERPTYGAAEENVNGPSPMVEKTRVICGGS